MVGTDYARETCTISWEEQVNMSYLRLNNYSTVHFKDGKPISIVWDSSSFEDIGLRDSLIAQERLTACGFNVRVSKPEYVSSEDDINDYWWSNIETV